jgi:hypothetical protein
MDRFAQCARLSNADLAAELERLAQEDRRCTVTLLIHLAVLDEKKVAEALGYPSAYHFCTQKLKFSEAAAVWRIHSARAAKMFPEMLDLIESGEMNITTVKLIAPYLTKHTKVALIADCRGKSRKDIEAIVASMSPSAPRRDVVVKCGPVIMAKAQWPEPPAAATGGAAPQQQSALDIVEAIDAERRRLHFDVGPDTAELLERARAILRHKFPFASLEDIVKEALNVLLDHKDLGRNLDKGKDGPIRPSAPDSRAIPMWVRRAVYKRDGGRCAFVGEEGRACGERSWLEFDHVIPFARGGRSDDPGNVRLLCRAHNRAAADRAFAPPGSA